MGTLSNAYPSLPNWEAEECHHEWLGELGYGDEQHVLLVAFGGRPGYAAIRADREPEELRAWVRQARRLYRRVIVDTCGYGGAPDKALLRRAAELLAEEM